VLAALALVYFREKPVPELMRFQIVPVENSVSIQMPLNESELKAQTPQGFPGNEEIQDTAASNLAIDGLKREGTARFFRRTITAFHWIQAARRS